MSPPMNQHYAAVEPPRAEIDALKGPVLLEFGSSWCGWCSGAQPFIGAAMADHERVQHIKIEDGRGKPLGRSFRVKLWPTLIFMRDGQEVSRLVRPDGADEIKAALDTISGTAATN